LSEIDSSAPAALRERAEARWLAGEMTEAAEAAWAALAADPAEAASKALVARLMLASPALVRPENEPALIALLADPQVDPDSLARAGWTLALARLPEAGEALAAAAEADALTLGLLRESPVASAAAERRFTALRHWLLTAGAWTRFPRLAAALAEQTERNGGAWCVAEAEWTQLQACAGRPFAGAYPPRQRPAPAPPPAAADVYAQVADQYERWPYPRWRRITRGDGATRDSGLDLLVAGCGTGREAALLAARAPQARIVAIDVSGASLAYAEARCAALGLANVSFVQLDLRRCAELGRTFDRIHCSGVLHHLGDPEAGLAALAGALKPGGALRVAVYSRIARLGLTAARRLFADLAAGPPDDERVRAVRRRILDLPDHPSARWLAGSRDFATLEGALDLMLHRHEDPFDIPRIVRGLAAAGLELDRFMLPTPDALGRYRARFPHDAACRDVAGWAAFERREPTAFAGMYLFAARKPLTPG
jgi:SAM-dependent methyltransferase